MAKYETYRRGSGIVKQGDIICVDLDPTKGHEQGKKRPALVISNEKYHKRVNLVVICPITSKINHFPLHVMLPETLKTKGEVKCEQVRTIDINARNYSKIETAPQEVIREVFDIVFGIIEI
ncbi:mRNA interferase PemK [Clostridia bacterium]|nr:mRNA interferase PemK [Clostridia bacterium]